MKWLEIYDIIYVLGVTSSFNWQVRAFENAQCNTFKNVQGVQIVQGAYVRLVGENHQPRVKDDLFDRVSSLPRIWLWKGNVPEIGYGSQ